MKPKTALILVDIQYDFLPPDGSLAVNEGNQILEPTYKLLDNAREYFDLVVASQDYHPVSHVSFASTHGKDPFTAIEVPKLHSEETITQMLWPDHCVQGSKGCELEAGIQTRLDKLSDMVQYIRKGDNIAVDSYSAFADNQYISFTPLTRALHAAEITDVVICGLATDYCVRATAIDACKFGFKTIVLVDAVRAVDGSQNEAVLAELQRWGCEMASSNNLINV